MLFPNSEEAAVLAGTEDRPRARRAPCGAHYPLVVVKRGAAGCEAFRANGAGASPRPRRSTLDSTGAGDAFVARFLAARLQGLSIEDGLARAAAAGAAATEVLGGRPEASEARD